MAIYSSMPGFFLFWQHLTCWFVVQQYSHIAAFALALKLGASIVLPPAVTRENFKRTYSQVEWLAAPLETLLDVDEIIERWHQVGMHVHKVGILYGTEMAGVCIICLFGRPNVLIKKCMTWRPDDVLPLTAQRAQGGLCQLMWPASVV